MKINNTQQATPTPWAIVARGYSDAAYIKIGAEDESEFACELGANEANAALIVRAVNEHAALLAVAEAAKEILRIATTAKRDAFRQLYKGATEEMDSITRNELQSALANLAAIRKGEA